MAKKAIAIVGVVAVVAVVAVIAFSGAPSALNLNKKSDIETEFQWFMSKYRKSYFTWDEYKFRLQRYQEVKAEIAEIEAAEPNRLYEMEINEFADQHPDEVKRDRLGLIPKEQRGERLNVEAPVAAIPNKASIDWRTKGAVTGVKNQGQCGSCWSFSVTGALEGAHFLKTGSLISLSEQQFVDCSTANYGCNGGWQQKAFQYAESHAIELESDYRYTARDGSCKASSSKGKVKCTGYKNVASGSGDALYNAVMKEPTSISVEADKTVFQSYSSGILDSARCGTRTDHAVLAVGYGESNGVGYFIVKNSWGTGWGDRGYLKIKYSSSGKGICGINEDNSYPSAN